MIYRPPRYEWYVELDDGRDYVIFQGSYLIAAAMMEENGFGFIRPIR